MFLYSWGFRPNKQGNVLFSASFDARINIQGRFFANREAMFYGRGCPEPGIWNDIYRGFVMRRVTLIMPALILMVGASCVAATVWSLVGPETGNWNAAANWSNGLPVVSGDGTFGNDPKAVFNVAGAAECIVDTAVSVGVFAMGDNGTNGGTFLRIVNGGTLTTHAADWSAVGYNRVATLTVETGGKLVTAHRLMVGRAAFDSAAGLPSHLIVDGGIAQIGQNLQMGLDNGYGMLTVDGGGLVNIAGDLTMGGDMLIDVRNGAIIINGNRLTNIDTWRTNGKIVAFGGDGMLVYDYNETAIGKTTITAMAFDTTPPSPDPATFASAPTAYGPDRITMAGTIGTDDNGPVQYLFTETSGNPGGASSGWQFDNSYTATGLTANTAYTYTVTLRDAFGNETSPSAPASATTWAATTADITWNKTGTPGNWGTSTHWTGTDPSRPNGNFKCSFTNSNRAECQVTGVHIFSQLVQNVTGVLRVQNGGSLTATASWSAVGYSQGTNRMIVETGGVVNIGGHLWVGYSSSSVGILDVNGGTVTVSGQFGLGWNGGVGYTNIRDGGVLNLDRIEAVNSIKGASILNIESGYVILNGDRTIEVGNYAAAGKITAYGGAGRVLYDYNATHPNKTTIRALAGVDGDVNRDGGVDIRDLALFADDWLVSDCGSPANFDAWCLVDYRDFAGLAANWLGGIITDWHVADTVYPTDDIIVTPHYAEHFGIVGDGVTDVTDAIQIALISIDNLGGGALFLPAGHYKVSGTLTVPGRVTLRGDWQKPQPGNPVAGTILQAYAGRGDENAAPFIELGGSAGINGITIWYPEQAPDDIRPYPPTIHGGGNTVENVTFVNAYIGFTTYREGTTARPFVRNVYGTPLKTGIEYDCLADIGRIETVHFSPDYWAGSGLADAPTAGQHEAWIYNNGTGMIVRRIDWSYSCYVTVEGYSIGFALRPSRFDGKYPNGQSYGFNLIDCRTGVYIEASAYAGYQFTRFDIQGAQTGVYLGASASETDMFHTCTIHASGDAILSDGSARVMMMSCDIQQGPLTFNGGYLSVVNSNFGTAAPHHIKLSSGVRGATLQGNTFAGTAQIVNNTAYPVLVDHAPVAADPLPAYDFKKPMMAYKPAKSDLYVVTEAPYSAAADGVTDDTAAFQTALDDAGANGGGIVFVPGGNYRLNGNLTVPTGVELKGVYDTPHGTREKGSLLNVYGGRNNADGIPFIQLEPGSGMRGLSFHYPEQIYDENDDDPVTGMYGMVPYPYLIRGLGADVYVINIAATIPYQLLDLATYRCDRHYVDYIMSTALKTGIHVGNGTTDGHIQNCQFNPSAYTHQGLYYDSIPLGTSDNIHKLQWRDATPYLFGHMTGQVLHQNFVFGGAKGVHTVEEGGFGPSGHCLGMGVDQCTNALQIDYIGSGGLDLINSQIVTVNGAAGRYLETGASLNDTFRMFSSAGWGTHQYSAVINGGDVRLQLFHLSPAAEVGVFRLNNSAGLRNLGGNLRSQLPSGRAFLTIDAAATAEFVGNVINTQLSSQMPSNTANVTSRGNLRVQ